MKVHAYCFLNGVKFDPLPQPFKVGNGTAWISNDVEPYTGQKKQEIRGSMLHYEEEADVTEFAQMEDTPQDPTHSAHFKKIGEMLDKYRGILNEVATIVEGLVSLAAIKPLPAFSIEHVNVRLNADTHEEEEMIKKETVMHTFGDIGYAFEGPITVGSINQMLAPIEKARERTSALAIYLAGVRAEKRFEMENAFTSFFRVIEGYLGDGSRNIENALVKQESVLTPLLALNPEGLAALHRILKNLSLPIKSTSETDGKGIISDIVLLRHKLMHYNLKNQRTHFYPALKVDLRRLVTHMHRAAFILLREDLGMSVEG